MELKSQFRCNGSNGYLAWLENALQIKETANETLVGINYDFQVFDNPNNLKDAILKKNKINNKARLVAGYCWNWISKKPENSELHDIFIEKHDFAMRWNLTTDGNLWIKKPESVNEVGCIHTCQGLEVDYIGVIIGSDIIVRNGKIIIQPDQRAKTDQSLRGYKKALKENPEAATEKAEVIIKNTYRTLMTRGQKGCYIFCTDLETSQYFAEIANVIMSENSQAKLEEKKPEEFEVTPSECYLGLTLRLLKPEEVKPYENAVPIYDLEIAAGQFSHVQQVEDYDWVELPDSFRIQQGHFVARVVGESMNRRIPNGAWCLFKANPAGSRNNKIVIVQHREIQDPDTGGSFTIKRYRSEKIVDGDTWFHRKIILEPISNIKSFEPIVLDNKVSEELRVIGEFIAVLA